MTYRIVASTDYKNLGQQLERPFVGEIIFLRSGFQFKVESIKRVDDRLIVSNENYILVLAEV